MPTLVDRGVITPAMKPFFDALQNGTQQPPVLDLIQKYGTNKFLLGWYDAMLLKQRYSGLIDASRGGFKRSEDGKWVDVILDKKWTPEGLVPVIYCGGGRSMRSYIGELGTSPHHSDRNAMSLTLDCK